MWGGVSCSNVELLDFVINKLVVNKNDTYEFYKKTRIEPQLFSGIDFKLTKGKINGVKYYNLKEVKYKNTKFKNVILYVHGGAFERLYPIQKEVEFIKKVYKGLDDKKDIYFINYKGVKYPEQNNELEKMLDFLHKNYEKVILIGDSSGANLITSSQLYRIDNNKKLAYKLILLSPFLDLSNRVKSRIINFEKDIYLAKTRYMDSMIDNKYSTDIFNPYVSPVYADFNDFPNTLIQVGDIELLLDDSLIVCKKINKSGGKCKVGVYKGMIHNFQLGKYKYTEKAIKKIIYFINKRIPN